MHVPSSQPSLSSLKFSPSVIQSSQGSHPPAPAPASLSPNWLRGAELVSAVQWEPAPGPDSIPVLDRVDGANNPVRVSAACPSTTLVRAVCLSPSFSCSFEM